MKSAVFLYSGQGSEYEGIEEDLKKICDNRKTFFSYLQPYTSIDIGEKAFEFKAETAYHEDKPEAVFGDLKAQVKVFLFQEASRRYLESMGWKPAGHCGYSSGVYAALSGAGALKPGDAFQVMETAGRIIHEEAEGMNGGMLFVAGLRLDEINRLCSKREFSGKIFPANINSSTRIILSGDRSKFDKMSEECMNAGALTTARLSLKGPYHTPFLSSAAMRFAEKIKKVSFKHAKEFLVNTVEAEYVQGAREIRRFLDAHFALRVNWKDSVEKMVNDGYNVFIDIGPGDVLYRSVRWIDRKIKIYRLQDFIKIRGPERERKRDAV